ncbi:hypothetical protein M0R45_010731 [Rubus argutus]|uniref:Uncharacterized protein n=1 Tax=Rubus argutus TaxID=59490 RepID=A0AAW1YA92_RUBAR
MEVLMFFRSQCPLDLHPRTFIVMVIDFNIRSIWSTNVDSIPNQHTDMSIKRLVLLSQMIDHALVQQTSMPNSTDRNTMTGDLTPNPDRKLSLRRGELVKGRSIRVDDMARSYWRGVISRLTLSLHEGALYEEDSVSSNDEPLPDVLPPQLADTPGLLLRSLGLAPPRPPATTASSSENPKARARGGSAKKKESTGQNPKSAETEATAPPRKRRKPAPDPKKWVALAYSEKKKDEYIYY